MKKLLVIFLVFVAYFVEVAGCTSNQRAKGWGGDMTINLPCGKKLIVATWKEDNLWYLTRPMREGDASETYQFSEDSSWGIMSGTVTFVECKK